MVSPGPWAHVALSLFLSLSPCIPAPPLAQLSTRTGDFIIDAIALRDRMPELNEVFTNPRVVKVGAGPTRGGVRAR